jgi:homoserine kinase
VRKGDALLTKKILVPEVHVALAVPELAFSTRRARAGLPTEVSMKDAVFNLGRTPLVVEALRTGDYELLSQVMEDRLHQAARLKLIPGARAAWQAALHAGAAAVAISGSGPSLIAFVTLATDATRVAREMAEAFAGEGVPAIPLGLRASAAGATVAS